ncbi:MAG: phosphatase PAP2 family protein [Bacteroidota bacterium]
MIETLQQIDYYMLDLLNFDGPPFLDTLMYGISEKVFWVPFYLLLLIWVGTQYRWQHAGMLLVLAVIAVALSDQTASGFFKPWIQRYRPCRSEADLPFQIYLVHNKCGGAYGFISSHAANFFAMATVIAGFLNRPKIRAIAYLSAVLVSYSRIYLGVHFPGDVLGGAIIGIGWGLVIMSLYQMRDRFRKKKT